MHQRIYALSLAFALSSLWGCEEDVQSLDAGDGADGASETMPDADPVDGGSSDSGPSDEDSGCSPITTETTAIGQNCGPMAPCPGAHVCESIQRMIEQSVGCQIPCTRDCECPTGYSCTAIADQLPARSWCVSSASRRCGLNVCGPNEICCGDGGNGCNCNPMGAPCPAPDQGCSTICDPGDCAINDPLTCEEPTGHLGNACCGCSVDGVCRFHCLCASPDTPIATPHGNRAISSLKQGDLVYSIHEEKVVAAPIIEIRRQAVADHRVVRVVLSTKAVLEISGTHPTGDGRLFSDLRVQDKLDGQSIVDVSVIPYRHDFTYDILADTDTGGYFAGGAFIASTLAISSPLRR